MKKYLICFLGFFLFFISPVFAAKADVKVGIVDVHSILENSPRVEAMKNRLKKDFAPQRDKIIAAQKALQEDMTKLQRDTSVMGKTARKRLEQKIEKNQKSLQEMQVSFQKDLFASQDKEMRSILDRLKTEVNRIAENHKLDIVLTKSGVAYFNHEFDVTQEVANAMK